MASEDEQPAPDEGTFNRLNISTVKTLLAKLKHDDLELLRKSVKSAIVKEMVLVGYETLRRVVTHPRSLEEWAAAYVELKKLKKSLPEDLQDTSIPVLKRREPVLRSPHYAEMLAHEAITPHAVINEAITPAQLDKRWEAWKITWYAALMEKRGINIPPSVTMLDPVETAFEASATLSASAAVM